VQCTSYPVYVLRQTTELSAGLMGADYRWKTLKQTDSRKERSQNRVMNVRGGVEVTTWVAVRDERMV